MRKILLTLLLSSSIQAYADIWGVQDAALLAKSIEQLEQLKKQYAVLNKNYKNAESQLTSLQKLSQLNSGHSGFGRLRNSLPELKQLQSANSWRETLKGVSGGNPERYQELVRAYEKQHATLNSQQYRKGASKTRLEQFDNELQTTKAASVESEVTFNDINKNLERIHELSEQIEKADNTKAAVDLNSRLLTEVAYLQAQNLKAQAILNQQIAMKSTTKLGDDAELSKYLSLK